MNFVKKENCIYAMDKNNQPVLTVKDGEEITFEIYDCFTNQISDETSSYQGVDWNKINPATGPVFVEGAEPGDTLKISIKKIAIKGNATLFTGPDLGVMGDELEENVIRVLNIKENKVQLTDEIEIPINKMIGVIGTAPKGAPISCGTPDAHGGNMDCTEISEGAELYLPVNIAGALLALGDCHAAMGDGEVSGCGAEIPSEVTVSVSVIKNKKWPLPFLIRNGKISTISSKLTVDEATIAATKNMVQLVENYTELSTGEAIHLLTLAGNLKICQIVDPNKTVRMELPLSYLKKWID
ncbi:acetamidase/formamidase family protein [Enterococcus alishanensis]|uniref:Acetamidase/formamidase family protein n=1 Tax=Enterococcus alishanensis TaxID=1303817 RepID=A0ABS6T9F0_9ENTE|nr:acetamidase/formamidase family protein [Enterococcus alishanensis]MBV7389520.1 acetamidase/formamidase family protein [Enterococcus alishanensis]